MNGNILDTNVIIRIIKGDNTVAEQARRLKSIHTSVVVIGELLFGAEKSQQKKSNRDNYMQFCLSYPILEVTKDVASEYGKLKCELQSHGNIMPENDMWMPMRRKAQMSIISYRQTARSDVSLQLRWQTIWRSSRGASTLNTFLICR